MSSEYVELIKQKGRCLVDKLKITGILAEEDKILDYGIKYGVILNSKFKGYYILYYKPSKKLFSIVNEKLEAELFEKIKSIYNNPDTVTDCNDTHKTVEYSQLDKYYNIIKNYRDKNFDFSQFAELLTEKCNNESLKKVIASSIYDFNKLEEIYNNYFKE